MQFVHAPRYRGPLANFTHHASAGTVGDGPFMEFWLQIESEKIREAAFHSYGCPSSLAAGGTLCCLVTGREVERALALTDTELVTVIGGLPEGKLGLAKLAIQGFRLAVGTSCS